MSESDTLDIAIYLERNVFWHLKANSNCHNWPCQVWMADGWKPHMNIYFLMTHGIIPKWMLVKVLILK